MITYRFRNLRDGWIVGCKTFDPKFIQTWSPADHRILVNGYRVRPCERHEISNSSLIDVDCVAAPSRSRKWLMRRMGRQS